MAMLSHGRDEEAFALFTELAAHFPENLAVLRGVNMAGIRMNDLPAAAEAAKKQAAILCRENACDVAWEIFVETQKLDPAFVLGPDEMLDLAEWLTEQSMHLDAARLYKDMAVSAPQHPQAPKALLQAAKLLDRKCGKAETAAQVLDYLLKHHPGVSFAPEARQLRASLKLWPSTDA
jgi:hypothetical protein